MPFATSNGYEIALISPGSKPAAALFKEAPADFLRMIVVHELAHLKESDHGKAFYALCQHMEPEYHQLEFDLRVYLTQQEFKPAR